MTTTAELRVKVLQKLEVLAVGETASAEDANLVDGYINRIHSNLLAKGKIYWPASSIPDEATDSMVDYVANKCRHEFGIENPKFELLATGAMIDMAELNAAEYEGEPNEACYF